MAEIPSEFSSSERNNVSLSGNPDPTGREETARGPIWRHSTETTTHGNPLLELLLERCREGGWLKAGGRQRTDSTHVLAKIRALNRTLCVAQTMVYALNVLSEVAPEWVRAHVPVEWVERYGERLEHERLPTELAVFAMM